MEKVSPAQNESFNLWQVFTKKGDENQQFQKDVQKKERDIHPLYTEGDFPINTLPKEGQERQMALAILSNIRTWMPKFKRR
jgi:hypothetical protein